MKIDHEFEIKALATPELLAWVDAQAVSEWMCESTRDEYLDNTESALFLAGIFLRIRNRSRLTIKYTPDLKDQTHTSSVEETFAWPLSAADELAVVQRVGELSNGGVRTASIQSLVSLVTIDKKRRVAATSWGNVSVDSVAALGDFVEIEAMSREHLARVAPPNVENIPVGYVELMLRKVDYALYARGRYTLEPQLDPLD